MPDKITQVNRDVRSDVNASVGSLGKLKAGEVGVKTDVVAKNLFEKYPNTDRIIVVQMMAATYCSLLRDSKTVRDSEKLRLWAEFSERVFKFENPNYNPTSQQAPCPNPNGGRLLTTKAVQFLPILAVQLITELKPSCTADSKDHLRA